MFGMLLGTLQRFKSDSAQKSEKVVGALYFVHKNKFMQILYNYCCANSCFTSLLVLQF